MSQCFTFSSHCSATAAEPRGQCAYPGHGGQLELREGEERRPRIHAGQQHPRPDRHGRLGDCRHRGPSGDRDPQFPEVAEGLLYGRAQHDHGVRVAEFRRGLQ